MNLDIKAIREQAENGYPVEDCVIALCDEVESLRKQLETEHTARLNVAAMRKEMCDEIERLQLTPPLTLR